MVVLDFQLSSSWRAQVAEKNLRYASLEDLHYDLFLGDVWFRCNGADYSALWGWIPIVDFAVSLARISRKIPLSGHEQFEFTESESVLDFEYHAGQVTISASYTADSTSVAQEELRRSVENFAERVLRDISSEFPVVAESDAFRLLWQEVSGRSWS